MSSKVLNIDMLETILEGQQQVNAETTRPCLLLHCVLQLICEVATMMCLGNSVQLA